MFDYWMWTLAIVNVFFTLWIAVLLVLRKQSAEDMELLWRAAEYWSEQAKDYKVREQKIIAALRHPSSGDIGESILRNIPSQ